MLPRTGGKPPLHVTMQPQTPPKRRGSPCPLPRPLVRATLALTLGLFASACQSADGGSPGPNDPDGLAGLRGAAIEMPTRPELVAIARAEAGRSLGDGLLVQSLQQGDATVRSRAAVALGRMPFPRYRDEVTRPLCAALSDPEPEVRASAAFALGQRRDPTSANVLLAAWNDPNPFVRARIVEAGARFDDPALRQAVVASLGDPDVSVAGEAALGAANWIQEGPSKDAVDRALFGPLGAVPTLGTRALERGLRWKLIYALAQRQSEMGRAVFLEHATSDDIDARLFSIRGLGRVLPSRESAETLEAALSDPDWRVAVEAAQGLGAHRSAESVQALLAKANHPSTHVRGAVLRALGNLPTQRETVLATILRGTKDASPTVRAHALAALADVSGAVHAEAVTAELKKHENDRDPFLRAAVARAAAKLPVERAEALLLPMTLDSEGMVAGDALRSLGTVATPAALERLREVLAGSPDLGLRLTALSALAPHARPEDCGQVVRAVEGAEGDVSFELWLETLALAAKLGGEPARVLALRGLDHPWYGVRDAARAILEEKFTATNFEVAPRVPLEPVDVPVAGRHLPLWAFNPMVEIETTRGRLVFELFPAETPLHVYNFLELARRGLYDGLTFHRVVADFVVQGGDPRGDGNGGLAWNGEPLVHEFTARPYLRGALGMPRSTHPDSGGCQIFVTHRSTPHLEGNYTIFGELRRGFDVLDRIEIGDRILSVRRLD